MLVVSLLAGGPEILATAELTDNPPVALPRFEEDTGPPGEAEATAPDTTAPEAGADETDAPADTTIPADTTVPAEDPPQDESPDTTTGDDETPPECDPQAEAECPPPQDEAPDDEAPDDEAPECDPEAADEPCPDPDDPACPPGETGADGGTGAPGDDPADPDGETPADTVPTDEALVAPATRAPACEEEVIDDGLPELELDALAQTFQRNEGQFDPSIDYVLDGAGASVVLDDGRATIGVRQGDQGYAVTLGVAGSVGASSPVETIAADEPTITYLLGDDPAQWGIDVAGISQVTYTEVAAGTSVAYRAAGGRFSYDLLLDAGIDPNTVALAASGATSLRVLEDGRLRIGAGIGAITFSPPIVWQDTTSGREFREARFEIRDDTVGFVVDGWVAAFPTVIDPTYDIGTYVGGAASDNLTSVVVEPVTGDILVAGTAQSADYPTTAGAYDTTQGGSNDFVVSRFDPTGSSLVWSTYIGGAGSESNPRLLLDPTGNLIVAGSAQAGYPTSVGAYDTTFGGSQDGVVSKLSSTGTSLLWSTYLGGTNSDQIESVGLTSTGRVVVTGATSSNDYPTTVGAYDTTWNGGASDIVVTALEPTGATLAWSTYLGTAALDIGTDLALTSADEVMLIGSTQSAAFPTTSDAYDTTHNGSEDIVVARLSGDGTTLDYSTYIGAAGNDSGLALARISDHEWFLTGSTGSAAFPTTAGAHDTSLGGLADGFVVRFDSDMTGASQLVWSTYFGGAGDFEGTYELAVDGAGRANIAALTDSASLATVGAPDTSVSGIDAMLLVVEPAGSVSFATYLGGSGVEFPEAVAIDRQRRASWPGRRRPTTFHWALRRSIPASAGRRTGSWPATAPWPTWWWTPPTTWSTATPPRWRRSRRARVPTGSSPCARPSSPPTTPLAPTPSTCPPARTPSPSPVPVRTTPPPATSTCATP